MDAEDQKIAESVRSGAYFAKARRWFEAIYIGPVSERTFFLVIAVLAIFAGFFSVLAIMRLLPITQHQAVVVYTDVDTDNVFTSLVKLAPKHESLNVAMTEYFITHYIHAREGFAAPIFQDNALFVRGHSDATTYAEYVNAYNPANATSPFNPLGTTGKRQVTVESWKDLAHEGDKYTTEVQFSVDTTIDQQTTQSKWTAKMVYLYTPLNGESVDDLKTGTSDLTINDPHFQVVHYELQKRS